MKSKQVIISDPGDEQEEITEDVKQKCLVEEHFKKENQGKSATLHKNYAYISCPCKKCKPYTL